MHRRHRPHWEPLLRRRRSDELVQTKEAPWVVPVLQGEQSLEARLLPPTLDQIRVVDSSDIAPQVSRLSVGATSGQPITRRQPQTAPEPRPAKPHHGAK